jgi:hypothetical protein
MELVEFQLERSAGRGPRGRKGSARPGSKPSFETGSIGGALSRERQSSATRVLTVRWFERFGSVLGVIGVRIMPGNGETTLATRWSHERM